MYFNYTILLINFLHDIAEDILQVLITPLRARIWPLPLDIYINWSLFILISL